MSSNDANGSSPKRGKSKSRSESSGYQDSVGFVLEQVGVNMMAYIFTYPVSSFDSQDYKTLYWLALVLVMIPPLLSCLPVVKIQNLRVFEVSSCLFIIVTLVAIYFSYKDDVEEGGKEQLDEITEQFFNLSGISLTNNTGPTDFASQLVKNAYLSTKHLHTFLINIASLFALIFTYMIVKCVKDNGINLIGLLGSVITLSSLGSVWYDTMKACLTARSQEVNVLFVGVNDVFDELYNCSTDFSSLRGASIAMLSFGCLAAMATLLLVMVRSGVMTCICSTCCCCFASLFGKCLTCATCGAADSIVGDAFVILGVVFGMLAVSGTHFTNAAWTSKVKSQFSENADKIQESFNVTEISAELNVEGLKNFLNSDWDAESMREFLTGAVLLLPAIALSIRLAMYMCYSGCKCCCGGNAKTSDGRKSEASKPTTTAERTPATPTNAVTLV